VKALKKAKRWPKYATKADLEALFRGLCCRIDAIGEGLSGTMYSERVRNNSRCSGNLEPLDYHKRGEKK
jgi:hypothetical protein